MYLKTVLVCLVLCAVFVKTKDCSANKRDHLMRKSTFDASRVKRSRYYSSPTRFYRRPPPVQPVQGAFSFTPPPGYMRDEGGPSYPQHPGYSGRPSYVSRHTKTEGLGAEDLNNIIKYLSKQDLDKIVEFASEQEKEAPRYKAVTEVPNTLDRESLTLDKDTIYEFVKAIVNEQKFEQGAKFDVPSKSAESYDTNKYNYNNQYTTSVYLNGQSDGTYSTEYTSDPDINNFPESSQQKNTYLSSQQAQYGNVNKQKARIPDPSSSENKLILKGPYITDPNSEQTDKPYSVEYNNQCPYCPQNYQTQQIYPNTQQTQYQDYTNSNKVQTDKPYIIEYNNRYTNNADNNQPQQMYPNTQQTQYQDYSNRALDTEESMQYQVAYEDGQYSGLVNQGLNDIFNKDTNTVSATHIKEEVLPRPVNLRNDGDIDIAFTTNFAEVIKPNADYKVESLRDLPLMNYHDSKLDTVSSYYVPHYTITSSSKVTSSSNKVPSIEPAPPASVAQSQSDAHLKAVKIWTHKSKGQAYYLHKDGTLTLERPSAPKPKYSS